MLSGHQRITWRRNIAENFNRLSRVHERYRQQTDDRRQTDGRRHNYSEHEHEFTFAKNQTFKIDQKKSFVVVSTCLSHVDTISECFIFNLLLNKLGLNC